MMLFFRKKDERDISEMWKEISAFFSSFQTEESKQSLKRVNAYVERHKGTDNEVGLCIVGSVAMGMATEKSDIDAVVFDKNKGCAPYGLVHIVKEYYPYDIERMVINSEAALAAYRELPEISGRFLRSKGGGSLFELASIYTMLSQSVVFNKEFIEEKLAGVKKNPELEEAVSKIAESGAYLLTWESLEGSFGKYAERLKERGIKMPKEIKHTIQEMLWKYRKQEAILFW